MPKPRQARNAVEALDLYCRKANARTLKKLGACLGASTGTNKRGFREGILSQARKLETLRSRRLDNGEASVTAIDAGVSNFAYSTFKWSKREKLPTMVDWNKVDLRQKFLPPWRVKMSMSPDDTFEVGHKLTEMFTVDLPCPDMFVIERQRIRSQSSKTVLESVLMSNIMEQILFSNLKNKQLYNPGAKLKYDVVSSNPQRMVQYWCDLRSLKSLFQRYKNLGDTSISKEQPEKDQESHYTAKFSKTIRISLVKKIINGSLGLNDYERCILNQTWREKIAHQVESKQKFKLFDCLGLDSETGSRKDDDLADCFLHGLAWMQWLKTYEEITDITTRNEGKHDQDVLAAFNKYCMNLKTEWLDMSPRMKGELAELEADDGWEARMKKAMEEEKMANDEKKNVGKNYKKHDISEEML